MKIYLRGLIVVDAAVGEEIAALDFLEDGDDAEFVDVGFEEGGEAVILNRVWI